uniref:Uncharacterized protein n=1 Tax=Octopus bimaculoides TaxID=37653 RepID=A0A0L8H9Y6_OCTBM
MNKKKETSATTLLKTLENFGENVATKIENATEATIMTENLAVVVQKVEKEKDVVFPGENKKLETWVKEAKTTATLPKALLKKTLGNGNSVGVSVMLFRNIINLMPNSSSNDTSESEQKTLNSMILSIKVGKKKLTQLEEPVVLGFQHTAEVRI